MVIFNAPASDAHHIILGWIFTTGMLEELILEIVLKSF